MLVCRVKISPRVTGSAVTAMLSELDMADSASRGADASSSTKECLLRLGDALERLKERVSFSPKTKPQSRLWRLVSSVSCKKSRAVMKEMKKMTQAIRFGRAKG